MSTVVDFVSVESRVHKGSDNLLASLEMHEANSSSILIQWRKEIIGRCCGS